MLTGAVLVGLQFGCDQPQTTLSAPGFPHASRQSGRPTEAAPIEAPPSGSNPGGAAQAAMVEIRWIQPRSVVKKAPGAPTLNAELIGSFHPGTSVPDAQLAKPIHDPVLAAGVERTE
jgi:hypothetical protein